MASSTSLQVAGLASNFDWKSFIDQIMAVEHAPADRLAAEKVTNTKQSDLLSTLGTKLTALQLSATDLKTTDLFGTRTAKSSTTSSTWTMSAATNTAVGTYEIAVSQLATKAQLKGAANLGADVSPGDTLANMATATAITAGTFTVNGVQMTLSSADASTMTLSDLLTKIQTEAGLTSASYDAGGDTVSLQRASGALMVGAAGDTSNVLQVLKLGNSGTNTVTSAGKLGVVKTTAALANANLATPITGVDGSGNGAFSVNGVSIGYNVNTDTLSSVATAINNSAAGVTAKYDSVTDQLVLTSNNTGDYGIAVNDTTGTFAASLGLTAPQTWTQGKNALFTVNGGGTITSASNTLTAASHGITGLSLTVDSATTQTITVAADTSSMRSKVESFISKFNDVQQFLEDETKITSVNGKVTTGPLASNREIQSWGSSLRSLAFNAVSGVTGSISRLDNLGIDFDGTSGELTVKDSAKLDSALANNTTDVAAYFQTSTSGFSDQFNTYLTNITKDNTDQQTRFTTANTGLDDQIAAIERQLDQQRSVMESAFIAMETAQSKLHQQQTMLTNAFPSNG